MLLRLMNLLIKLLCLQRLISTDWRPVFDEIVGENCVDMKAVPNRKSSLRRTDQAEFDIRRTGPKFPFVNRTKECCEMLFELFKMDSFCGQGLEAVRRLVRVPYVTGISGVH